jgi:VanZ family protein
LIIFLIGVAMFFGILWETGQVLVNGSWYGLEDTLGDLLFDFWGAAVATVYIILEQILFQQHAKKRRA